MKTIKKHLWVTERQDEKLKEHRKNLGLTNGDIFRRIIDDGFPYANLYLKIYKEVRKEGNNLNQIAKYVNENEKLSEDIKPILLNIENNLEYILKELRNYDYKNIRGYGEKHSNRSDKLCSVDDGQQWQP